LAMPPPSQIACRPYRPLVASSRFSKVPSTRVPDEPSAVEYQDPVSSRAWQVEAAGRVIAGRGRIVAEFFDAGASRSLPWARRPQAAALLAAARESDRWFDAVVVGEFERAFAGGEAQLVIALLASFGVQVWLPEARGPVDLATPEHQALLMMLGHQAEREVLRNRFRTSAAMAAQVREQGRNLGAAHPPRTQRWYMAISQRSSSFSAGGVPRTVPSWVVTLMKAAVMLISSCAFNSVKRSTWCRAIREDCCR